MSRFLIWGGGGHGKVVADLVRVSGYTVAGYVDRDPSKLGRIVEPGGARVVMLQDNLLRHVGDGCLPENVDSVALAIGCNRTREQCMLRLGGLAAPALVHPAAVCSLEAAVDTGTVVFAAAVINSDARIGRGVIVNTGAIVEHDCVLADGVHVSPGAVLNGGVEVGERSWIGAGATLIQGIRIGVDVIIGAGAVIIRDVPDGVTVVGVPGRILRPIS